MKIRRFNTEGHSKWINLYNEIFISINKLVVNPRAPGDSIIKGFTEDLKKQVKHLQEEMDSTELSEEIKDSSEVNFSNNYENSFNFAKDLNSALKNCAYKDISSDKNLWDWVSLKFFDQIFVPEKMRGYYPYRYILDLDWRVSMRHLARGPWWAINSYGDNAIIFTLTPLYQQNDNLEQFIKVNHMREMKIVPEIATKLYYNSEEKRLIPGVFKVQKKVKPGSFSRLKDKISHFSKVMNLWEMDANDIIKILPKEFDIYK